MKFIVGFLVLFLLVVIPCNCSASDISKQNDTRKDDQQSASNDMVTFELIGFRISKPRYGPSRIIGSRRFSSPSAVSRGFGSSGGLGSSFSSPSAGSRGFGSSSGGLGRSFSSPSGGSRGFGSSGGSRGLSRPSAGSRGYGSRPSAGSRGYNGGGRRSWPRGSSSGYYGSGTRSGYYNGAASSTPSTAKLSTLFFMTLACFVF